MNKTTKKICAKIITILMKPYSYNRSIKINYLINVAYTISLKQQFFKNSGGYIARPLYLFGTKYISIGDNFMCGERLRLEAFDEYEGGKYSPQIIIGNNVSIQKNCHIGAINKITIGDNVLIASNVYISDHSHGEITTEALSIAPIKRQLYSKGEINIEDNVWIGEAVAILPNVTIGKNSIIGTNSVVTKSIPPNSVVAGNPAKIIKTL